MQATRDKVQRQTQDKPRNGLGEEVVDFVMVSATRGGGVRERCGGSVVIGRPWFTVRASD